MSEKVINHILRPLKALPITPDWYKDNDSIVLDRWFKMFQYFSEADMDTAMDKFYETWALKSWPAPGYMWNLVKRVENERRDRYHTPVEVEQPHQDHSEARETARSVSDMLLLLPEDKQLQILSAALLEVGLSNPGWLNVMSGVKDGAPPMLLMEEDGVLMGCTLLVTQGGNDFLYSLEKRL